MVGMAGFEPKTLGPKHALIDDQGDADALGLAGLDFPGNEFVQMGEHTCPVRLVILGGIMQYAYKLLQNIRIG